VKKYSFSVPLARFGDDHVTLTLDDARDLFIVHRDSRDAEFVREIPRAQWGVFLERIGQAHADDPVDGARRAERAGKGAAVVAESEKLGKLVFSEIDWEFVLAAEE